MVVDLMGREGMAEPSIAVDTEFPKDRQSPSFYIFEWMGHDKESHLNLDYTQRGQ